MATIRNSMKMHYKGKVGAYSFYTTTGNRQIARVSQNSSNYGTSASRSESQQMRRAKWANLVNFYKANKGWMHKAYESKTAKQSDYNKFVSLNIANSLIYLTKSMYASGGCVAQNYQVSEGSLAPITDGLYGNYCRTNVLIGELGTWNSTTIGQYSQSILDKNSDWVEGDQLSLIYWDGTKGSDGIPRLKVSAVEITLDTKSTVFMKVVDPNELLDRNGERVATELDDNNYSCVFIHTRKSDTGLLVSSEVIVNRGQTLINEYSSDDAISASVASYTVNEKTFLDPGYSDDSETPIPGTKVNITGFCSPSSGGSLTGLGTYEVGDTCTISVEPASGYSVNSWSVGGKTMSAGSSVTFIVQKATQVICLLQQS